MQRSPFCPVSSLYNTEVAGYLEVPIRKTNEKGWEKEESKNSSKKEICIGNEWVSEWVSGGLTRALERTVDDVR